MSPLEKFAEAVKDADFLSEPISIGGRISSLQNNGVNLEGMPDTLGLGDFVSIVSNGSQTRAEIVKMTKDVHFAIPCSPLSKVSRGAPAFPCAVPDIYIDDHLLGRVINAFGDSIDGLGPVAKQVGAKKAAGRISPMRRGRVEQPLKTGVRMVDVFTPLCVGQRLGVFAGSGVGKSTLLAMFANSETFDAIVIALVGERSREVREFVEDTLGPSGLEKSIVVVATSDDSAVVRKRAPMMAMDIATDMAKSGKKVLYLVDSLTRYAHALREVAISLGEPPISRGYPASVFNELPRLLEAAGPSSAESGGSITVIATVLVDGDDHNDPVSDSLRGILDGHLVLDRALANRGRFPSIDPLASISRLSQKVWTESERALVTKLRAMIAMFEDSRDLRMMGGYQPGNDAELDNAVALVPSLYEFFKQESGEPAAQEVFAELAQFLKKDTQPS
ncbi:MAG: FliI/YscN family ATPase [Pseudomonadota bacterium]